MGNVLDQVSFKDISRDDHPPFAVVWFFDCNPFKRMTSEMCGVISSHDAASEQFAMGVPTLLVSDSATVSGTK